MSKKKANGIVLLLLLGIAATVLISLTQGELSVSLADLKAVILGQSSLAKRLLVVDFRLPRIVLAILAGAALGMSGTILQSITQNPLADTGILGINAGAGLAVILFISFIETTSATTFLLPLVALIGGLVTALLIVLIAYNKRLGITPVRMVLTGVILSTGISALTLLITTKIDTEKYRFVTMWQAGSIWGSNWFFVGALLPWLIVGFLLALKRHRIFDILQLGDETAISVGIPVKKERIFSLILAVVISASAISVTGGIGFLGLIAPHIARKCGFVQHKMLLPLSALFGSLLLIVSDTIGRLIPGTGEIPAGIIVAIVGAPYFLYLLLKSGE